MSIQKLETLCEIRPGYQFRKGMNDAERDGEAVRVIQIKDTEGGRFRSQELETARVKNARRYFVSCGDVLLLTRGQRFHATLVDVPVESTVAVYFFLILTPKNREQLDPAFLAWTLNHPLTQETLHSKSSAVHMPFLSPKEVREFELAVPPLATQRTVVELDDLKRREAELAQALLAKRAQMINEVTWTLAHQLHSTSV